MNGVNSAGTHFLQIGGYLRSIHFYFPFDGHLKNASNCSVGMQ